MLAETIENEIKHIIETYDEITDTAELENILRESFHKVRDAVESETLRTTDGWICEFCEEIFTGRDKEEAEVKECEICGCIACKPCIEEYFLECESGYICKDCDNKMTSAIDNGESDTFVYD